MRIPLTRLSCGITLALLAPAGQALAQIAPAGAAPAGAAPAAAYSSVVTQLLAQARYWQAQNQPAQSLVSLQRALQLDPTNADALSLRIKIELAQGDNVSANQDLATLKQVQPQSLAIPKLMQLQSEAANPIDTLALSEARSAAQAGQYGEAINLYQQAFHGTTPPTGYATEYYQTMAGTPANYAAAISGLSGLVTENPDDLQNQVAFATVQTYQSADRQAGIARLASLAAYPKVGPQAQTAWKQALTYLPETADSIPLYKGYLAKYPGDATVSGLLAAALTPQPLTAAQVAGNSRLQGFNALKANQISTADGLFEAALKTDPNDSNALGGMGLVRLREGRTVEAQSLLRQAIAANPDQQAQWQAALNGASRGAEYATASAMMNRGNLSGAARQLRSIIAAGGDVSGAQAMLATVRMQQGDLSGAANAYRAVLAGNPNNGPALVGLGTILARQGDQTDAQTYFQKAEANGQGALVQGAQAQGLRSEAQAATDPMVALSLYRAAVAAAPQDPWARLDLARALRGAGQDSEARSQMDELVSSGPDTSATLQAAALFAVQDGRQADAAALVARLPSGALTPDMRAIRDRGALAQQIANAQAQAAGNPQLMRQLLVTMAAAPDQNGERGSAIAAALAKAGDPAGAQLAIQAAVAANPGAGGTAMISYAGALMANGQDAAAAQIVQSLQLRGGLTPDQQTSLAGLQSGIAIRASDRLAAAGHLADAYSQLAPGLTATPRDPSLNAALARLYVDDHQPRQALAINQALLQNDPNNVDARAGAVDAAVAAHDYATATALVQAGEQQQPGEPRIWLMAANVAQAQGDNGNALDDLHTAENLRQQQLVSQAGGASAVALASATPVGINPFGVATDDTGTAAGGMTPSGVPSILGTTGVLDTAGQVQTDPMSQQIATQINTLTGQQTPSVQMGLSYNSRSGSTGLDQLQTISAPITGSYSPRGVGNITLSATPTFLSSGADDADPTSQSKFGSDALNTKLGSGNQDAAGIGVAAAYSLPWLKVKVGSTPVGFRTENLVGSVELDPTFSNSLRLALSVERSAVTDSVLSYASTVDPNTGITFGGVLRDRAAAQVSMPIGPGYVYAGGGYDELTGTHVAKNTEIEFGAGGDYPVVVTPTSTTSVGVNVTYFSYAKNLRHFTLGQGGYFSPQSYFAATVPLDYKETDGNLDWNVGGTVGLQDYSENSSAYYPLDKGLQQQLVSVAAADSVSVSAYYPATTSSGLVGGAHASFEYHLNTALSFGGSIQYDRTADWNQTQALFYARYLLGGTH